MTRKEIKAHLKPFQVEASYLQFFFEDDEEGADSRYRQILDTVELVRYNPHLDSEGEIISADFWLLWLPAFFDQARPHLLKGSSVSAPEPWERRFPTEYGTLHPSVIQLPEEEAEGWATWQKARRREWDYPAPGRSEGLLRASHGPAEAGRSGSRIRSFRSLLPHSLRTDLVGIQHPGAVDGIHAQWPLSGAIQMHLRTAPGAKGLCFDLMGNGRTERIDRTRDYG
jgi:hypothetical protein